MKWAREEDYVASRQLIAELHKDDRHRPLSGPLSKSGGQQCSHTHEDEDRGVMHVAAALGESVQFFGDRNTTDFQECRMLSIRSMWRKRCVILAQSSPPKLRPLPLGVNAD